ncbi:MAG: hypothetical protein EAX86_13250 [Candidatus Heimdallarchaeota archaeon]|nr:hypothetical protein [Candidatus Heimdallarchaeota archaeon]
MLFIKYRRIQDFYLTIIFILIICIAQFPALSQSLKHKTDFSAIPVFPPRLQIDQGTDIILQTPENNSHVTLGSELLFQLLESFNNTVLYHWELEASNSSFVVQNEYFILYDPNIVGIEAWILLFVYTPTNVTTWISRIFRFYYDTHSPQFSLSHANMSTLPAFSSLQIDFSENVTNSQFRWDANPFQDIAFNASSLNLIVELPSGVHLLEVYLSDVDGNLNHTYLEYDISFAVRSIPPNNSVLQSGVLIAFQFSNPYNALYAWDACSYSGVIDPTPSSEGIHVLHVNVEKAVGSYELWIFLFEIDNTPIGIIVSPTNGTVLPSTNVTITLTETPQMLWGKINSISAPLYGDNPYWVLLPSTYGFSTLKIEATDEAGNLAEYIGGYNISLGIILITPLNGSLVEQGTPIAYQLNANEWRTILFNVDTSMYNTTYLPSIPSSSGIHNLTVYLEDTQRRWTRQFFQWAVLPHIILQEYSNNSHIRSDSPLNFTFGEVLPLVVSQWGADTPLETLNTAFFLTSLSEWSNSIEKETILILNVEGKDTIWANLTFHFTRDEESISINLQILENMSVIHAPFVFQVAFNETPTELLFNWDENINTSVSPSNSLYSFTIPQNVASNPHILEVFVRDSACNWNMKLFLFYTGIGLKELSNANQSRIQGGIFVELNLTDSPHNYCYSWLNCSNGFLVFTSGWLVGQSKLIIPVPVVSASLKLFLEFDLGDSVIINQSIYYQVDSTAPEITLTRAIPPFCGDGTLNMGMTYFIRSEETFTIAVNEDVLYVFIIWNNGSFTSNQSLLLSNESYSFHLSTKILGDVLNNLTIVTKDYVHNQQRDSWFFWRDNVNPTVSSCVPRRNTPQLPLTNVTITFSEIIIYTELHWFRGTNPWYNQSFSLVQNVITQTLPAAEMKYTIEILYYDEAANMNTYTCWFTVDGSPPQITITPRNHSSLKTGQVIEFTASEAVNATSYYQWEFEVLPTYFDTTRVVINISSILEGTYQFIIFVQDLLGNNQIVRYTFTIDDTPFSASQVTLQFTGTFTGQDDLMAIYFAEEPSIVLASWNGKSNVSLSIRSFSLPQGGIGSEEDELHYMVYVSLPHAGVFSVHHLRLYIQDLAVNWASLSYQFLQVPTQTDILSFVLILGILGGTLTYSQRQRILNRIRGVNEEFNESEKNPKSTTKERIRSSKGFRPSQRKTRRERR